MGSPHRYGVRLGATSFPGRLTQGARTAPGVTLRLDPSPADPLRRRHRIYRNHHHWSPLGGAVVATARLFQSRRSQAVRRPKGYRFSGSAVALKHFGNGVLLLHA